MFYSVIFLAWTKPLVKQQAEAIVSDVGIAFGEHFVVSAESKKDRVGAWKNKRVFFGIQQAVMQDIEQGHVDLHRIRLGKIFKSSGATGLNHRGCL